MASTPQRELARVWLGRSETVNEFDVISKVVDLHDDDMKVILR